VCNFTVDYRLRFSVNNDKREVYAVLHWSR
jgi:hypothetical protein